MYEAAASCKDIARAPVTNWEPHGLTFAGYCYVVRHGMKVQLVTPYRVTHLQRYGVTVRGNVTSVDPPLMSKMHSASFYRVEVSGFRMSPRYVGCVTRRVVITRKKGEIKSDWSNGNCDQEAVRNPFSGTLQRERKVI